MAEVTYETNDLIAGPIKTGQVPFAADTYYQGMPLEFNTGTARYEYLTTGSLAGFFLEKTSRAITAGEYGAAITGGEVYDKGIVDDSNVALTITETMRAAWTVLGFYAQRP